MADAADAHIPVRNPEDIAHLARFVATYGRGLLRVMAETAAGMQESGSPSVPTAEDTAYAILAALPALGWVRVVGAGEERAEWAQRSSPGAPHGTQPWWTEDIVREGVRMWREAGKPDAQALRRNVRTVTTPDGWTHVSTGPWEVAP